MGYTDGFWRDSNDITHIEFSLFTDLKLDRIIIATS